MKEHNNIPKGYKPSTLGPIPNDWENTELRYVANKIMVGIATEVKPHVRNTGIPILRNQNIRENYLDDSDVIYISEEFDRTNRNKRVKIGDILIVRTGSNVGQACIVTPKFNDAQTFTTLIVRPGEKLNSDFLSLHINSFGIQEVERLSAGGGKPNLNAGFLHGYRIALPGIKEQRRIAKLIFSWDKAINTLTQLIAQKEQRKKWLMQQLLTGKKRLKGFKGEWKEYHLSDLFERVTRRNADGNTNIVTISAQRGFVRQDDFFNKVVASEITENYFLVKRGEFCYNKSYSNGYPWGATKRLKDFDEAVVTTLYICFSIKNKKLSSGDFFESFFEANLLDRGLTKIAHEGGRAHGLLNVTPSDFFSLKMLVPEIEEQKAIASLLSIVTEELKHLMHKEQCLKEQKKGLMQILLTGKKRLAIKKV